MNDERLLDCRAIQEALGVRRATAEAIMRQLPKVQIDGVRKTFVWSGDLDRLLKISTTAV